MATARLGSASSWAAPFGAGTWRRVEARLLARVDAAWLAAFRFLYGCILSISLWRFIAYGWVERFFVQPSFHFKYFGLGWVGVLPGPWLHALFWALGVLALLVAFGVCFRLTAALFVLGFTYLQLLDVTNYLNHYYLAVLLGLLLTLSPAGRAYSLDAIWSRWAQERRCAGILPARGRTVPAAWLYLLRFQVAVVYFCAGLAKLDTDWLLAGQPLGIWLGSLSDFPLLGRVFREPWAALALSWAGFLFDSTIVFWLLWGRARPWAYLVLIVFHALTGLLFPIGMFPIIMTAAALVFFDPGWPRALGRRLLGARPEGPEPASADGAPKARPGSVRALLALGLCYCAVQAALPLRFALYPANVRWHEQGMRFAWRVMVREKNGSVSFRVTNQSGRTFEVSPARYLTPLQEREMAGQPDLIVQLAQHVRDDFMRRGLGPVEVRADAWSSLNGRRARRLIDPDVDLGRLELGLSRAAWILPAPSELAPSPRG